MEHPQLFEPDDPVVARVRELAEGFPECAEVMAWGRPTFRAGKKIFAVVGAMMHRPHSLVFKPDPEEYRALRELDAVFVPPYFGPSGWLALELALEPPPEPTAAAPSAHGMETPDEPSRAPTDWEFVAELLDTSYRQVALKRQLAALDARPGRRADG